MFILIQNGVIRFKYMIKMRFFAFAQNDKSPVYLAGHNLYFLIIDLKRI